MPDPGPDPKRGIEATPGGDGFFQLFGPRQQASCLFVPLCGLGDDSRAHDSRRFTRYMAGDTSLIEEVRANAASDA